jgi:release factor glutamine methyltransferase
MNANYQPVVLAIKNWLEFAQSELKQADIDSARLDAEILLAHSMKKSRTYLHAHIDEVLDERTKEIANARLALRLDYVPIAYIIGHKEFYGRQFKVTTATLIPRPESEAIIELLKEFAPMEQSLFNDNIIRLVDVGTGSGCLGITAKLEIPELNVTLLDISSQALTIAKQNISALNADVSTLKSDLLREYPFTPEIIIANLPYVDASWDRSIETNHEPEIALFASQNGLTLINKLITQSDNVMKSSGLLILEADIRQHDEIVKYASKNNFELTKISGFCLAFTKN